MEANETRATSKEEEGGSLRFLPFDKIIQEAYKYWLRDKTQKSIERNNVLKRWERSGGSRVRLHEKCGNSE